MPTFRYFAEPHAFSTYTATPQTCAICHREGAGYKGPFYGPQNIEFVCEECLATGRLADIDAGTNMADIPALRQQVAKRIDMNEEKQEALIKTRTVEIEQRTPHIVTWQDWDWPAHCGDYCRFIKEIGKTDVLRLTSAASAAQFILDHAHDVPDLAYAQDLWDSLRPDSPTDNITAYSLGMYLFQCLDCGDHSIMWDMD